MCLSDGRGLVGARGRSRHLVARVRPPRGGSRPNNAARSWAHAFLAAAFAPRLLRGRRSNWRLAPPLAGRGATGVADGRTTLTDDWNIHSRTARGVVWSSHSNALSDCAHSWLLLSKAPPSGPRRICLVRSRACAEATLNHIPGSASAPGGSDGRSILASCSIGAATSRNRAIRLLFAPARTASTLHLQVTTCRRGPRQSSSPPRT